MTIDLSQYEYSEPMQKVYLKTCVECENTFETVIPKSPHCGNCSTVAQVVYVHYMTMMQRWGIYPPKPNPIVERVLNTRA